MRLYHLLAFLAIAGTATATRPQLSLQVRDGSFEGIDTVDPAISWSSAAKSVELDVEYGIEASARPSEDAIFLPRSIWGKASSMFGTWKASVRGEIEGSEMSKVALEIDAENQDSDLAVKLTASTGDEFSVHNIEAIKGFDAKGARFTLNPRYSLDDEETDVVIGYNHEKTSVELTASRNAQSVTISQKIDDNNRLSPTLGSDGAIILEWERTLGSTDDNVVTTTVKPNDSINVEWKDAAWTANVNVPVTGTTLGRATVNIKREVFF